MLDESPIYELALVRETATPATLAVVGLVARARRLLRASISLADAEHHLEAMILIRSMVEYQITLRWLLLDPDLHWHQWIRADLRSRLVIDREMTQLGEEIMTAETRQEYENYLAEIEGELAGRPDAYPSLQERARAVGQASTYSLAYRFDSQAAAHPSALALELLFEERAEGVAVLPEPLNPPHVDPYRVGATLLLDMLEAAREHEPELELAPGFDELATYMHEQRH